MKIKKILAALLCAALTGCQSTQHEISRPHIPGTVPTEASGTTEPTGTAGTQETQISAPSAESPTEEADVPDIELTVEERAQQLLDGMTIEEKAGQLVLARYPGGAIAPAAAREYHLGGFTLFGADFRDAQPEDISAELADVRNSSEIMPIFAVDEEGGTVVRVSKYPQFRAEPFPAQSEVLAEGGADGAHSDALEKAALLLSLGLNANLAPVCDVPRSGSDYIADRAFSTDPAEASAAVAAAVRGYVEMRVLCALKHFPGYGDNSDTHTGISRDSRPMSEFEQTDLLPFRAGIEAGAPVVMISHNIVECVDSELPGSLSENMYALLRGLGFDGVIMTDDLSMDAIAGICGEEQSAVTAFCAGADLLCSSDYENAVPGLIEAAKSGKISAERLDSSVRRILEMKLEYGIIQ